MNNQDLTAIKIPTELVYKIDEYMETNKQEGYTTRSELVKSAIRDFLNNNGNINKNTTNPQDGERRGSNNGEGGNITT